MNLKSSKSFPNDLAQPPKQTPKPNQGLQVEDRHEEGDNSSSGVSSDQEVQQDLLNKKKKVENTGQAAAIRAPKEVGVQQKMRFDQKNFLDELNSNAERIMNKKTHLQPASQAALKSTPVTTKVTTSIVTRMINEPAKNGKVVAPISKQPPIVQNASSFEERSEDDGDDSPSPPSIGFQRHNSLTRKQAALAAQRAKAMQSTMRAVSLAKLPPPMEHEKQEFGSDHVVVLAPPPEFSDFVSRKEPKPIGNTKYTKTSRLHSQ